MAKTPVRVGEPLTLAIKSETPKSPQSSIKKKPNSNPESQQTSKVSETRRSQPMIKSQKTELSERIHSTKQKSAERQEPSVEAA